MPKSSFASGLSRDGQIVLTTPLQLSGALWYVVGLVVKGS